MPPDARDMAMTGAEVVMVFRDRAEAGRLLAARLSHLPHLRNENAVVLGLPGGGVPIGFEVARALNAPLDVIVVRKLGVPFQPELAMGAIGEGGVRIVHDEVVQFAGVTQAELDSVEWHERAELQRRARRFRGDRQPISLSGRTVVLVDDGIATGSTAEAACEVARALGASHLVLAVPVAPSVTLARLSAHVDEVVCLDTPEVFWAVGQFYEDFSHVTDDEVVRLLDRAADNVSVVAGATLSNAADPPVRDEDVEVLADHLRLAGHLTVPGLARGIVVFAHGSGSSRHSPRNRSVASALNEAGFGTLLFDLLSVDEELDRSNVFDVELLAARLRQVTAWLRRQPEAKDLPVGYFGASTGAAAALCAAADPANDIFAVVSRGGRPDLAASSLSEVRSPTLLIVGLLDDAVLALNRRAQDLLHCENRLAVVPGATHLFEEPGALKNVAELARDWFKGHLAEKTRLSA